jgi:aspartate carbamoyltransferase catalytic subunit
VIRGQRELRHIIGIRDLSKSTLVRLLDRAGEFVADPASWPSYPRLVLGLMFFEPSTRTLLGFQSAAGRLGGSTILLAQPKSTADMGRPESLEDTVQAVSGYCDALVLRHAEERAPDRAAAVSSAPLINAGNGAKEHPSQALIDLFAIRQWHQRLGGLRVGIIGDLCGSRAAHSLVRALEFFEPAEVRLMYPRGRGLPAWVAEKSALPIRDNEEELHLRDLDVLYMAGLPQGQGQGTIPDSVRARFRLTPKNVTELPSTAVVLCPLPRIDEIAPELDDRHNVRHFEQSRNGLFVRMAVLEHVLGYYKLE